MAILPLLTLVLLIAVTEREVKKKCAAFGRMPAKPAAKPIMQRTPALTGHHIVNFRPRYTTYIVASCLMRSDKRNNVLDNLGNHI